MKPDFVDPASSGVWRAYAAQIDRALAGVDPELARDLRGELVAHLAEHFATLDPAMPEPVRLKVAIARLGRPADFLRPMGGELAPGRRAGSGSMRLTRWLLAVFCWLLAAIFVGLALLKPFWPSHVGIFHNQNSFMAFGVLSDPRGMHDVLGWWFVPVALAMALAFLRIGGVGRLRRTARSPILPA